MDRPHPVRGTAELLAVVPHLLGYRPDHDVVLLVTDGGAGAPARRGRPQRAAVIVSARVDLPGPGELDLVLDTVAPMFDAALRRAVGRHLRLHAFLYDADRPTAAALATGLTGLAGSCGVDVHELAVVRSGCFLVLVGPDGEPDALAPRQLRERWATFPRGWQELPDPADVPAVADLVLSGRSVATSREEVATLVRRRDEPASRQTAEALRRVGGPAAGDELLRALRDLGELVHDLDHRRAARTLPDAPERARIVRALGDREVRDAVLGRWLPGIFDTGVPLPGIDPVQLRRVLPPWPGAGTGALDRLLALAAAVPEETSAPVLTVAGAMAWATGEGTIANAAVDLALELEPGYRLAHLLRVAIGCGLDPRTGSRHQPGQEAADVA